jgi:hypothetical protein
MKFIAASCAIKAPFNIASRTVEPWKPHYAHKAIGIPALFVGDLCVCWPWWVSRAGNSIYLDLCFIGRYLLGLQLRYVSISDTDFSKCL